MDEGAAGAAVDVPFVSGFVVAVSFLERLKRALSLSIVLRVGDIKGDWARRGMLPKVGWVVECEDLAEQITDKAPTDSRNVVLDFFP